MNFYWVKVYYLDGTVESFTPDKIDGESLTVINMVWTNGKDDEKLVAIPYSSIRKVEMTHA